MDKVNLQLFSFGFDCPLSFLDKIRCAGEMGYSGVEFVRNYENIPVEDVQKALQEAGVQAVSAHVAFDFMEQDLPYLAKLGMKYVACPMTPFKSAEEAKEVAADLNKFGKMAKPYGITIGYHNHTDEFVVDEGKYLLDWVIENTDPETVAFEIDCGWASAAGVDHVAYIQKHAGRICAIHIKENGGVIGTGTPRSRYDPPMPRPQFEKDENGNPIIPEAFKKMMEEREKLNVPQGTGIVDWKAVKAAADAQWNGEVLYVVEREASYGGKDRITCLKEDIAWLKENL